MKKGKCRCGSSKVLRQPFLLNKALRQMLYGLGTTSLLRGIPDALKRTIDYCFWSSSGHRTASSGRAPPPLCNDYSHEPSRHTFRRALPARFTESRGATGAHAGSLRFDGIMGMGRTGQLELPNGRTRH